jgi:hypothetical protein
MTDNWNTIGISYRYKATIKKLLPEIATCAPLKIKAENVQLKIADDAPLKIITAEEICGVEKVSLNNYRTEMIVALRICVE